MLLAAQLWPVVYSSRKSAEATQHALDTLGPAASAPGTDEEKAGTKAKERALFLELRHLHAPHFTAALFKVAAAARGFFPLLEKAIIDKLMNMKRLTSFMKARHKQYTVRSGGRQRESEGR